MCAAAKPAPAHQHSFLRGGSAPTARPANHTSRPVPGRSPQRASSAHVSCHDLACQNPADRLPTRSVHMRLEVDRRYTAGVTANCVRNYRRCIGRAPSGKRSLTRRCTGPTAGPWAVSAWIGEPRQSRGAGRASRIRGHMARSCLRGCLGVPTVSPGGGLVVTGPSTSRSRSEPCGSRRVTGSWRRGTRRAPGTTTLRSRLTRGASPSWAGLVRDLVHLFGRAAGVQGAELPRFR